MEPGPGLSLARVLAWSPARRRAWLPALIRSLAREIRIVQRLTRRRWAAIALRLWNAERRLGRRIGMRLSIARSYLEEIQEVVELD